VRRAGRGRPDCRMRGTLSAYPRTAHNLARAHVPTIRREFRGAGLRTSPRGGLRGRPEHRTVCLPCENRGFASRPFVAPRSIRRVFSLVAASAARQLRNFARSGKTVRCSSGPGSWPPSLLRETIQAAAPHPRPTQLAMALCLATESRPGTHVAIPTALIPNALLASRPHSTRPAMSW